MRRPRAIAIFLTGPVAALVVSAAGPFCSVQAATVNASLSTSVVSTRSRAPAMGPGIASAVTPPLPAGDPAWSPAYIVIPVGDVAVQVRATVAGRGAVRAEVT